ncbi:MAG: regulatory iron-sulfur-containing complex subunit RicT [Saprospiraceae bacterium]
MNTYDWLAMYDIEDPSSSDLVEVSFKHGAKKEFFWTGQETGLCKGEYVVVDSGNGWDIGEVSLTGPLVEIQMKKKHVSTNKVVHKVMRRASNKDVERLEEARNLEKPALVRARVIARTLGLEMKIGDVQYQADLKKATFYYTADGRVDFRELVRNYAKEFRIKVEMRQIGARQESARIGGLGPCGRELCCSTWLSDFKSVSTVAARYQNLAINQAKLSGQCGRLKCCLNYELDTYLEALEDFPNDADEIRTRKGKGTLIKLDIFKGIMYYAVEEEVGRSRVVPLDVQTVWDIIEMQKSGTMADDLTSMRIIEVENEEEMDFADVTGQIELPNIKKKKKRKGGKNRGSGREQNRNNRTGRNATNDQSSGQKSQKSDSRNSGARNENKPSGEKGDSSNRSRSNRNRGGRNNRNRNRSNQNPKNKDA